MYCGSRSILLATKTLKAATYLCWLYNSTHFEAFYKDFCEFISYTIKAQFESFK